MADTAVTLEQWQILSTIDELGGFQAAADHLGKSQSTVSYAMQKLQEGLGVNLFERGRRKAELTPAGQTILRRARVLLQEARQLETASRDLAQGWEPELRVVVDVIVPQAIVLQALELFAPESRGTRLDIFSESLSGTEDFIVSGNADIAFTGVAPIGFLGESLFDIQFVAVAHPEHALSLLAEKQSTIAEDDLKQHRQIVVRDSGVRRRLSAGWLGSEERWTVASFYESRDYVLKGLGFAFIPEHVVEDAIAEGDLRVLPLAMERRVSCKMLYPNRYDPGPAALLLGEKMREAVKHYQYARLS